MYLNTDILFSTTGSIYGREITQHLGILAKRALVSADIGVAEMLAVMDTQYAALAEEMNKRAKDIGADAVVGVDFRTDRLDGGRLMLSVTGNAVRLKPAQDVAEVPEAKAEEKPAEAPEAKVEEKPAEAPEAKVEEKPAEAPEVKAEAAQAEAPALENIEIKAAEPAKKPKQRNKNQPWKCQKCDSVNDRQFRYCPKCGEIRHFDWKCSACGQENPSEYKFCPGCGKTRTREEEYTLDYSEAD